MQKICTCIIPFYNEEKKILATLEKLSGLSQLEKIIVVDDGSTDDGKQLVQNYISGQDHIQLVSYEHNKGKSHAVSLGLDYVTTPYVLLFDADLSNIRLEEISYMVDSVMQDHRISMGVLRRVDSSRFIKFGYRELLLSGQRILRTDDLKKVFTRVVNKYQLEVAINMYMKQHKKICLRYPFTGQNSFKYNKRGFRYGWKRDMGMFRDIFSYIGKSPNHVRKLLFFKPQYVEKYNKKNSFTR